MPSPVELLLDPISLAVIAMYAGLLTWETFFPARTLPPVKYWKLKGIVSFALFFYLSSYLPLLIDPILGAYQLVDLSGLGTIPGALVGILFYELVLYGWHRGMHQSNILWRSFHQMHHSAERTDVSGAFFFSPLDMIGFTLLGSLCFALVIGLSPSAITLILLTTNFFAVFQHANIKTPRWIGYWIQRPESHAVHHARGIHRYNYSDLPVFDILFGTFHNPKVYEYEAGFYNGSSNRIKDMLLMREISHSPVTSDSTSTEPAPLETIEP